MISISTKRLAVSLIGCGIAFVVIYHTFHWIGVTSPHLYSLARKSWSEAALAHFPYPIPDSGRATDFYYINGPVQAGKIIKLTIQYSEEEFRNQINELKRMPTTDDAHKFGQDYVDGLHLHKGFEAYVIHAKPVFYNNAPSWNHGKASRYTTHLSSREIEYWAESW